MIEGQDPELKIEIRAAVIEKVITDSRIKHIIEKIKTLFPLTFTGRSNIEYLADDLDEIFWLEDPEGTIMLVNKFFPGLLNLRKSQVEGRSVTEFLPEPQAVLFRSLRDYVQKTASIFSIEGLQLTGYKFQKGQRINELPIFDNKNNLIAFIGFSTFSSEFVPDNEEGVEKKLPGKSTGTANQPSAIINSGT